MIDAGENVVVVLHEHARTAQQRRRTSSATWRPCGRSRMAGACASAPSPGARTRSAPRGIAGASAAPVSAAYRFLEPLGSHMDRIVGVAIVRRVEHLPIPGHQERGEPDASASRPAWRRSPARCSPSSRPSRSSREKKRRHRRDPDQGRDLLLGPPLEHRDERDPDRGRVPVRGLLGGRAVRHSCAGRRRGRPGIPGRRRRRARWRSAPRSSRGVEYGLAHEIHKVGPQTAQTLNMLDNLLFLPLVIGGCVFGVAQRSGDHRRGRSARLDGLGRARARRRHRGRRRSASSPCSCCCCGRWSRRS